MTVQASKEKWTWSERTKMLAAGLLVAVMAACLMLVASPAHASTTFTVNSTADAPDASTTSNTCDTDLSTSGNQCTLRAAIQQANATSGADAINFHIPGKRPRLKTISPASALPAITEQVSINGYTQRGASPNTKAVGNDAVLKIQLDGTNALVSSGLEIANSSGSVIKGLVINRFGIDGIEIHGASVANRIEGNFIGTDASGTLDLGNATDAVGIFFGPSENVVGGSTRAARNLLSGSGDTGIFITNSNANRLQGNYVGTDRSGTKELGNEDGGIFITNASNTIVGGNTTTSGNVVSANGNDGIDVVGTGIARNRVVGNRIGTTASGTGFLGNDGHGLAITSSSNFVGDGTSPGGNTIAFNGRAGIKVTSGSNAIFGTENRIDHNSIFSNGAIGIDLAGGVEDAAGRTANDPGDADTGSNGLQNFPVITSAKTVSGKTTIQATLDTNPGAGYIIQFFSNPSGGDEGKTFLGEPQGVTDASGNATITFSPSSPVSVGNTITAIVQGDSGGAFGNTSEFSAPRTVTSS